MKTKYNKISKMRTFEESPAKKFRMNGCIYSRQYLETYPYNELKRLIKKGKIEAVQVIKNG